MDQPSTNRLFNKVIETEEIEGRAKFIEGLRVKVDDSAKEVRILIHAIECTDLTTLNGNDTPSTVEKLCKQAAQPLEKGTQETLKKKFPRALASSTLNLTTAAVCVYPSRIEDALFTFRDLDVVLPVASVAGGFPSGQYPLETRLLEIKRAVEAGANEIDIVIDRSLVLRGLWDDLYNEIREARKLCPSDVHLKTILSVGELDSLQNVHRASLIAMKAGSDFIKTSTGKENVNATIPFGIVMCRAIAEFHTLTGRMVGFKPAGGIKTVQDAIDWYNLIQVELGDKWQNKRYFRIGASSLLSNVQNRIEEILKL